MGRLAPQPKVAPNNAVPSFPRFRLSLRLPIAGRDRLRIDVDPDRLFQRLGGPTWRFCNGRACRHASRLAILVLGGTVRAEIRLFRLSGIGLPGVLLCRLAGSRARRRGPPPCRFRAQHGRISGAGRRSSQTRTTSFRPGPGVPCAFAGLFSSRTRGGDCRSLSFGVPTPNSKPTEEERSGSMGPSRRRPLP